MNMYECCMPTKTKRKYMKKYCIEIPSVKELRKQIANRTKMYNDPNTNQNLKEQILEQLENLIMKIKNIVRYELQKHDIPKDKILSDIVKIFKVDITIFKNKIYKFSVSFFQHL